MIGTHVGMMPLELLIRDGIGVAVGGEFPGEAHSSQPGEAAGVLLGGQGAPARVRVHGQRQPRGSPLQKRATE